MSACRVVGHLRQHNSAGLDNEVVWWSPLDAPAGRSQINAILRDRTPFLRGQFPSAFLPTIPITRSSYVLVLLATRCSVTHLRVLEFCVMPASHNSAGPCVMGVTISDLCRKPQIYREYRERTVLAAVKT